MNKKKILVTGGTGYIGSHTAVLLVQNGYEVIIIDNLCNSSKKVINQINKITSQKIIFHEGDICDDAFLSSIFKKYNFDAVMHFAGLKSVSESLKAPLNYFHNNVTGTIKLLKHMAKSETHKIVFSSSATIYGEKNESPLVESMFSVDSLTPYGTSKIMIESLLKANSASNENFKSASLRYFNPIGAHPTGLIGEHPVGKPENLLPFLTKVAAGKYEFLEIYGSDYPTKDGTCERDFIHVMDLAEANLFALNFLGDNSKCKYEVFNIGTGKPTSVLELVNLFKEISETNFTVKFSERREGDLACVYADPSKAQVELGWKSKFDVRTMLEDAWNWEKKSFDI